MFDVLIIDPPWQVRKGGLRKVAPNQGRDLDYPTMPSEAIFELLDCSIFPLAAPQHTVFLWTVDKFLHEAEQRMLDRGYRLHARMIWSKLNGVAPAFSLRYAHEYVLWFYKPKFMPVERSQRGKLTTVFEERAREHSRKPDIFYSMVRQWFPAARCIDVFSREKRSSFAQYGNQTDHFGE